MTTNDNERCGTCGQSLPLVPEDRICATCSATFGNYIHYTAKRCGTLYGCTITPGHKPADHHPPAPKEPERCESMEPALGLPQLPQGNRRAHHRTFTEATVSWPPNENNAPPRMIASLTAYIEGQPTGGFLRSILENDLSGAVMRADDNNGPHIADLVLWVYQNVPAPAWGSPRKVADWIRKHRVR